MTNEEAIFLLGYAKDFQTPKRKEAIDMAIKSLKRETEEFEWCHDCKEYDQEAHCCHRWTKAIRKTVEEIKNQWIPCEERLPQTNVSLIYCTETGCVGEGRYEGYNGIHRIWKMYAVCGTHWDDEVLAWTPLPKPYEGGTE